MITPEFLEELDYSKLVMIYSKLNIKLTELIIESILKTGKLDSYTKRQLQTLLSTGGKEIFEKALEETSLLNSQVKDEVKKTYTKMAQKNMQGYKKLYEYKGIEFAISKTQLQILNQAIKQTGKDLINFTKTIAFSGQQAYVNAVDNAYFQVITGGRDYISVIEDTVKELAKQGITLEDSAGRKVQLETAVRRNILTGIKQTADEITDDIEKELGCNGYEVTSHAGARPSHAEAQGKQYAITEKDAKKYNVGLWSEVEHLWKEYNCRHTYFGIILGISEPVYTNKELKQMENAKVTYKGKKIPEYEATQIQRQLEREQRNLKRQIEPLKNSKSSIKDEELLQKRKETLENLQLRLNKKQTEYKQFCKETGLTPQYERTKVI